jgi:membrane fusion protein (multidrug efflux system)
MKQLSLYLAYATVLYFAACAGKSNEAQQAPPPPALPVVQLETGNITTWQSYPASVEGTRNVEIRPQIAGYIEKVFVEDGQWVQQGAPLFRINAREYNQYGKTADANIQLTKASVEKAQLEVDRLTPLVANKVIADVQLKSAKAILHEAEAAYAQAISHKSSTDITVGYTLINAPVSGYIGHINFKEGSLIGKGEITPLTVVSEVNNMHAYFSMSEADFLSFFAHIEGKSIEEKIHQLPAVQLELADHSLYAHTGKVELVEGQFSKNSGSIAFRAVFPNQEKLLRSGISGKVRIPSPLQNKILVPQQSTYELQDKVYVFALTDSNKVTGKQIKIAGKSGQYYIVESGLNKGETIVFSGLQRLREGTAITPQTIKMDSALAMK